MVDPMSNLYEKVRQLAEGYRQDLNRDRDSMSELGDATARVMHEEWASSMGQNEDKLSYSETVHDESDGGFTWNITVKMPPPHDDHVVAVKAWNCTEGRFLVSLDTSTPFIVIAGSRNSMRAISSHVYKSAIARFENAQKLRFDRINRADD